MSCARHEAALRLELAFLFLGEAIFFGVSKVPLPTFVFLAPTWNYDVISDSQTIWQRATRHHGALLLQAPPARRGMRSAPRGARRRRRGVQRARGLWRRVRRGAEGRGTDPEARKWYVRRIFSLLILFLFPSLSPHPICVPFARHTSSSPSSPSVPPPPHTRHKRAPPLRPFGPLLGSTTKKQKKRKKKSFGKAT